MKRVVLWLPIIIAPTLLWFALTHSGRAAWHRLFPAAASRATTITLPRTRIAPIHAWLGGRRVILIPAHRPPTQPALYIRLDGAPSLALLVTDPKGRRSGIELDSRKVLTQIPHSQVHRMPAHNDGMIGKNDETIINVVPAKSTIYSIALSGRHGGKYYLAIGGVSPSLKSTWDEDNGDFPDDTTLHYKVNLKNIVQLSPLAPVQAHPAADAAHAYFRRTGQSVLEPIDPKLVAAAAAIDRDPCGYFFRELKSVSHGRIKRSKGELDSAFDNSRFSGCQVTLYAPSSLALFHKVQDFGGYEDTYLYRLGWRQSRTIAAGGYGSGDLGVEDRSRLCVVSTGTPENIVNYTGPSLPAGWLIVTVQCRHKGPGAI